MVDNRASDVEIRAQFRGSWSTSSSASQGAQASPPAIPWLHTSGPPGCPARAGHFSTTELPVPGTILGVIRSIHRPYEYVDSYSLKSMTGLLCTIRSGVGTVDGPRESFTQAFPDTQPPAPTTPS